MLDVASLGLSKLQPIAAGAFGKVYKTEWRGRAVAVKVISADQLSAQQVQDFQREIELVMTIHDRNVVLTLAASSTPPNMVLVMVCVAQAWVGVWYGWIERSNVLLWR